MFLVSHVLHNSETQLDRGSMAGMCRIHCKPWNHWAHGSTQSQRGHLGQWSLREVDGSETHSCRVFPARAAGACLHLPRRGLHSRSPRLQGLSLHHLQMMASSFNAVSGPMWWGESSPLPATIFCVFFSIGRQQRSLLFPSSLL